MTTAICPGSFDPITLGHVDIICRAAEIFDEVVVCVMHNAAKKSPMFTLEEKLSMARRAVEGYKNVRVDSYDGLLTEYVRRFEKPVVVKGLRAVSDFEYEFQMALANKKLFSGAETVFLTTSAENMYLSSSVVKQIAYFGGDISHFVPESILEDIQQRLIKER